MWFVFSSLKHHVLLSSYGTFVSLGIIHMGRAGDDQDGRSSPALKCFSQEVAHITSALFHWSKQDIQPHLISEKYDPP